MKQVDGYCSVISFSRGLVARAGGEVSSTLCNYRLGVVRRNVGRSPIGVTQLLVASPRAVLTFRHIPGIIDLLANAAQVTQRLGRTGGRTLKLASDRLRGIKGLLSGGSRSV